MKGSWISWGSTLLTAVKYQYTIPEGFNKFSSIVTATAIPVGFAQYSMPQPGKCIIGWDRCRNDFLNLIQWTKNIPMGRHNLYDAIAELTVILGPLW